VISPFVLDLVDQRAAVSVILIWVGAVVAVGVQRVMSEIFVSIAITVQVSIWGVTWRGRCMAFCFSLGEIGVFRISAGLEERWWEGAIGSLRCGMEGQVALIIVVVA